MLRRPPVSTLFGVQGNHVAPPLSKCRTPSELCRPVASACFTATTRISSSAAFATGRVAESYLRTSGINRQNTLAQAIDSRLKRLSPGSTRQCSTACCSMLPPIPSQPSPPTQSIWARRSARHSCRTRGARRSRTILTYTASFPAEASRQTVSGGLPAGPASSCQYVCCRACS